MTISIGTSTPSSAWETHAAWLRLRGDCQQLLDEALEDADHGAAVLESRDATTRMAPNSGDNILV
ncbi:hypothetical protein Acy02nite_08530 [Actinoplanes cyaneus]|uniref:Uncharacterized protein n=1 Tax=Actinoplanes cyaneus TaxID=52696 RepID=A0A919IEL6_9ACTN|nr:hypothetical protein [Actinoplanes cyaneus]MCW2135665.1 hypothetical protein [Actinoplanes cyaneus]GID62972.1 hypothetical protein Acy02nite_08530 [Actinoplanes cyaneus]